MAVTGPVGEVVELEAVQPARTVVLVLEQVGEVGDRDPLRTGAVAPDPQGRLLGHDPAGEERGGRLAEQLGHLGLDLRDGTLLGVHVPLVDAQLLRGVGDRPQRLRRGAAWRARTPTCRRPSRPPRVVP